MMFQTPVESFSSLQHPCNILEVCNVDKQNFVYHSGKEMFSPYNALPLGDLARPGTDTYNTAWNFVKCKIHNFTDCILG